MGLCRRRIKYLLGCPFYKELHEFWLHIFDILQKNFSPALWLLSSRNLINHMSWVGNNICVSTRQWVYFSKINNSEKREGGI